MTPLETSYEKLRLIIIRKLAASNQLIVISLENFHFLHLGAKVVVLIA